MIDRHSAGRREFQLMPEAEEVLRPLVRGSFARSSFRFADKRIAALEAQLLEQDGRGQP